MPIAEHPRFVYNRSMDVDQQSDAVVSRIAADIGAPARARMLYCLVDGRARTSTELALVAEVTPSTASVHLQRLETERLVRVVAQGKHRYYSLEGAGVAAALEALSVFAGGTRSTFVPGTPIPLRAARTCYDHIAGALGVAVFDRLTALSWLSSSTRADDSDCDLTPAGAKAFQALGVDIAATRALRRRFAFACVDWSERRPHLGGALGAALLDVALRKKWVRRERESRALAVTAIGRREMEARFGVEV
jgi:DNA-binding transcriptional ArsR family regulator